ncbi:hypothetical protein LshimejAT787_1101390 [Lyophyllum shimeji]|uniref:Uncharacterized protein n=1 Tax=Lyophyllum shimeji TaxID=47721 RepID=A0A9P3PV50_LYOSH|nr:hypothetical protein LshimejAT787_1101390 [Lyophyllum shimeji]
MKFSAIFVTALPAILLFSGSAMARNPEVEARDIAAAAARARLVARHNQEWDIYRRGMVRGRRCTTSQDCRAVNDSESVSRGTWELGGGDR